MHVPVAAAAGATTGAGVWLFSYNRENFQYDAGMRFQRFMAARGFANSQTSQYREDIHGLTEMTVAKMDTWQSVCTLFLCVCAALSCAGRLGMHGSAPPGWLCALYSGNIFLSIMYTGLALWLALHASLRAQCAMVSLLTRKVRLPIPSLAQLDQARVFGSSYEQQRLGDIFRVPFMRHPEYAPDIPSASSGDSDAGSGKGVGPTKKKAGEEKDPRKDFGSTERTTVPSWIRDEQVVDKVGGVPGGSLLGEKEEHEQPEHFKLMAKAMEEWWQYDVYARITMLYGVMHFLFAVTYYSLGTTISELRGFWISWSLPMLFLTAQVLILRLDILKDNGQKFLPNCEWFGHLAPYMAIVGTTLEFRFWYDPAIVILTWVFVLLAFFGHFMMELRLLDLAWPDMQRPTDMAEEPTRQWWPASWKVPTSFSKALWILAPPKKLEGGQHCLLHEMDELKRSGAGITACRQRRRKPGSRQSAAQFRSSPSPQALVQQCMRIDRSFQWWFDSSVWMQVSEAGQRQLRVLYAQYQPARLQVDQLPGASGSEASDSEGGSKNKAGAASDTDEAGLARIAGLLAEIEDGLEEAAAKNKVGEARGAGGSAANDGAYTGKSPFMDFGTQRAPDLPWQVSRVAILTAALLWFFMLIASAAECVLGPESLLKPPGEPPWIRDQKTRGWTPAMVHTSNEDTFPDDYGLFNAILARPPLEGGHGDGSSSSHSTESHTTTGHQSEHRRLSAAYSRRPGVALGDLLEALPSVGRLADALEAAHASSHGWQPASGSLADLLAWRADTPEPVPRPEAPPVFLAPPLDVRTVAWPPLFEPHHLLCGPQSSSRSSVAALTSHGFGALVPLSEEGRGGVQAQPFALEGLGELGPLAGAAWTEAGLELVTRAGELLHCPGHMPAELGAWPCKPSAGERLPLPAGSQLLAAAIGWPMASTAGRTVALLLREMPATVALLTQEGGRGGWSPAGEVHLPPGGGGGSARPGLAFAGEELLITTEQGEVHRRHLRNGKATTHAAPAGTGHREFRAACALPGGDLIRLALRQAARPNGGVAWGPELLAPAA